MKKTKLLGLEPSRKKMGLTQAQLAKMMNVERYRIADWEQGRSEPSINNLILLSDILDVSMEELLGIEYHKMFDTSDIDLLTLIINNRSKEDFYCVKLFKPYNNLKKGTKGAILGQFDDDIFYVKFVDNDNKTLDTCLISKEYLEVNTEFIKAKRHKL